MRRATTSTSESLADAADKDTPPEPAATRPIAKAAGQQLVVEMKNDAKAAPLDRRDPLATTSLAPIGNSWHQEFLAMNQPAFAGTPYGLMNNAERLEAVASGMAFAFAFQEAYALIGQAATALKDRKARKLRKEIDEERLAVEALYKASLQGGATVIKERP